MIFLTLCRQEYHGLMQKAFKIPESVLIVIYTEQQQVLLLERCYPDAFWQSVTGSLELNETPAQTAKREVFEETGLNIEPAFTGIINIYPIHPAWRNRYHEDIGFNKEYVFTAQLKDICEVKNNPAEHCTVEWLDKNAAAKKCSSITNSRAIDILV